MLIHFDPKQGYLVHQRIKRTEGTDPFAERPIKQHTQNNDSDQDHKLSGKQLSQCRPDPRIND